MRVNSSASENTEVQAWYGLGVLFIAYTVSFIDRTILSLLVEPVKAALSLSDTEVSLLHGLAFAVFYTFLGIPIARLADHYSRKRIITVGILVWSLMTAACGLAGRFSTLFLARVGVGVGEAALSPAAYSLITDLFPKKTASTCSKFVFRGSLCRSWAGIHRWRISRAGSVTKSRRHTATFG